MAFWGNLTAAARLAWDYVGFTREPLTLEQSVQLVREHLARREEHFLANLERVVVNNPRSPYRRLFEYAGCELGDVRHSVQQHGLEGALQRLQQAGVYLTYEEFKGGRETVRGSKRFHLQEQDFDNPLVRAQLISRSGGTTGRSTSSTPRSTVHRRREQQDIAVLNRSWSPSFTDSSLGRCSSRYHRLHAAGPSYEATSTHSGTLVLAHSHWGRFGAHARHRRPAGPAGVGASDGLSLLASGARALGPGPPGSPLDD